MNYLELDEVIAEALSIAGSDASKYETVSRQWAYTALMELGSSDDEIDACELFPKNLIAKKPEACRQIISIQLFDVNGYPFDLNFRSGKKKIISSNENAIDVSEDRHHIILGTNGADVAKVRIEFYSYPLDNKGQPMIREDEKLAIMFYIRWMIALSEDDNMSKIQMDEHRWMMTADRTRAKKKASDFSSSKLRTMTREWLRLIPSFNHRKF